ncbi:MAG: spore coat protein U domain-containing protein [Rhizobiales bacterium]|nr:spore coat protein U domain-containing protein [Hyphomicrobiales bacterium]MBI3672005.1 spore coat protein U domain-containing protein [Hyphomicrobiales bacterium]
MRKLVLPIAAVAAIASASAAAVAATTVSSNFNASITIQAECKIQSLGNLNFGSYGVLDTARTASAGLDIQCTNGTGYAISLSNSATVGSITAAMTNAGNGEDVAYTATLSSTGGTGNGSVQSYTVGGNVPAQNTPSSATYTDTETVYVTY